MRLIDKIKKLIAWHVYNYFAKYLPISYNKGGKFGKTLRGWCASHILKEVGTNINVEHGALITADITLGDRSGIGINASINGTVNIGKDVMMGPECIIYARNHAFDRTDIPMIDQGFEKEKPVTIEDDVWIGGRVTIMPGVTVHKGAILAAGAVVTKDVPAFSIVGGNPANIIKSRL